MGATRAASSRPRLRRLPLVAALIAAAAAVAVASALPLAPLKRCAGLSAGLMHTCVASVEGNVLCFGKNERGECGTGTGATVAPVSPNASFVSLRTGGGDTARVVHLAAASNSTAAVFADGGLIVWGQGYEGAHARIASEAASRRCLLAAAVWRQWTRRRRGGLWRALTSLRTHFAPRHSPTSQANCCVARAFNSSA